MVVRGLISSCQLTDRMNLGANRGPISVRRYVEIREGTIEGPGNGFATCDAVGFDVGIPLVSLE